MTPTHRAAAAIGNPRNLRTLQGFSSVPAASKHTQQVVQFYVWIDRALPMSDWWQNTCILQRFRYGDNGLSFWPPKANRKPQGCRGHQQYSICLAIVIAQRCAWDAACSMQQRPLMGPSRAAYSISKPSNAQQWVLALVLGAAGVAMLSHMAQVEERGDSTAQSPKPTSRPIQHPMVTTTKLQEPQDDAEDIDMPTAGPSSELSSWSYRCWEPQHTALAQPVLTIATDWGSTPKNVVKLLRKNRLHYAARHGYRFCELMATGRAPSVWHKFPWLLALSPCSAFTLYMDPDAVFSNLDKPLTAWTAYMAKNQLDQLFAADIYPESNIDFGVFMIRHAPWLAAFYKRAYNMCPCSWGRTSDWPSEQSIMYDLLTENLDSLETRSSRIVSGSHWDRIVDNGGLPHPADIIIHLVKPKAFPPGHHCATERKFSEECKNVGLIYYLSEYLGQADEADPNSLYSSFNQKVNSCRNVRAVLSASGRTSTEQAADTSTTLDYDTHPATGEVMSLWVAEEDCPGHRERTCRSSATKALWPVSKDKIGEAS